MDEDGQGSTNSMVIHHFLVHPSVPWRYPARIVEWEHRAQMMPFRTHQAHKNNHKQQTTRNQHATPANRLPQSQSKVDISTLAIMILHNWRIFRRNIRCAGCGGMQKPMHGYPKWAHWARIFTLQFKLQERIVRLENIRYYSWNQNNGI
jgi:hypothetical protein